MEHVTAVHVPQMESADAKPSRAEILRGFINEKLTKAAEEIFAVVERTITGYEEEASGLKQDLEQRRRQMETVVQLAPRRPDEIGPLPVYAAVRVEAEQRPHTHAAGSPDVSGRTEEAGVDCEKEEAGSAETSQSSGFDQNPQREPSHLVPHTGAQSMMTLDPITISVCLSDPIKLQTGVLNSSVRMMTCPRGLRKDDFLSQLSSTFPQLMRPFEVFTIDASGKPRPLKTESLTPENIYKNMESAEGGGSTLYIHLKAEDQQQSIDETRTHGRSMRNLLKPLGSRSCVGSDPVEKVEREDADVVSISSGAQQVETDNDDGESWAEGPDPSPGRSDAEHGDGGTPDHGLRGGATDATRPSPSPGPAGSAGEPSGRSDHQDEPSGRLTRSQPSSTRALASRQLMVCLLKDARISTLTKEATVSSHRFLGHAEEKGGTDGAATAETAAQSRIPDLNMRNPAQLISPRRDQCVRTRVRKSNHLRLRVCLMKNIKSRLVKSPIQVVRCLRSMTEDSFLAALRAAFPHFTGPFEAFTADASRRLLPLKPKALTPENVCKSIKSTGKGRSALYIRVQQTCEKEKKQQDSTASTSVDSASDGEKHLQESAEDHDGSFLCSVMRGKQVRFRVRLLKDKATDVLKKGVLSSAVRNLKCPRGMDEDAFLNHLRSSFPRLTGAFDAFTTDTSRRLIPLRMKSLTPENVYTAIKSTGKGRSALYIRARVGPACSRRCSHVCDYISTCRDPVETVGNKDAEAASSSSAEQPTDTDGVCAAPGPSCASTAQSDADHSGGGQNLLETTSLSSGWKRNHTQGDDLDNDWRPEEAAAEASSSRAIRRPLHIRVCLLNDTQTNVLATKGHKCRVQKLRCPRKGSFLDMLRSNFPHLPKGNWPFDAFLTDKHKRLQRLEVQDMTPEEIYRSMKASGNGRSALYVRRKLTKPSANNKEQNPPTQRKDEASSDPPSSSNTREAEDEPHGSSTIGLVGNEKSSEGLHPIATQIQAGGEAQESPSVSAPPSAPESDDDEVDSGDRDVDWKPDKDHEEQEQSEPDGDLVTMRKRAGKRSRRRRSAAMKSPPERTAEGFYSCKACGSLHRTVNILLKHAWRHVDHAEKLCGVCGAPADGAEELRRHLDAHMKTHACNICGRYFLTLGSLKKHTALHSTEQPFRCALCPKAYATKQSLMFHSLTHIENKPYKCDVCHQAFGHKSQMEAHATTHTGEKPYRCGLCGKTFAYFKCLSLHRSVHTSQKCYACQVCGKRFNRLVHMKAHERIHAARDKSFLCDVCCKAFCSLDVLKAHLKTHSRQEKTLCTECGKELSSAASLRRHMIVHADQRPYSCSTCGRAFNALSTLRVHTRTHTGEKRFTCKVCGKASSRRTHLKIHMRTHSGERPYKCSICPKDFTQSHCLKTHMKSHYVEKRL
ncbi:uncharacterized protein LOC114851230 isoform X2 [Betta splendens]|uniref:Uncharacterized protein LOC114851230 isoform X2 n=1 Tax=Betta splendens TaxID=158456 RepID=A0A6P7LXW6_BETSP|nr:uncharacterized protein LOC114851230 isoform X2 [Betta splendens]